MSLLRECTNCPYGGVKVSQRGPSNSPLVIIGDGPTAIELAKQRIFTGPSNELLDKMLDYGGFTSNGIEPLYVNAIECFPRDKKTGNKKFKDGKGVLKVKEGGKYKYARALKNCRNRLLDIIAEHPRQMIITLGAGALHSITNDHSLKITHERGTLIQDELSEKGTFVISHPTFVLKGGGSYKQFRNDFKKAFDLFEGGKQCTYIEPKEVIILETKNQVMELASVLRKFKGVIGADIETGGFNHLYDEILELGLTMDGKTIYIIPDELIHKSLFHNNAKWLWHNGKFDIKFLWAYGCLRAKVHQDTMMMSYVMNEIKGVHDLEQVGSDWLGAPDYKDMIKPYLPNTKTSYRKIPADVRRKYLGIDVALTYQLYAPMRKELYQDKILVKNYTKVLIPGSNYLAKVEWNGFLTDSNWVGDHYDDMLEEIALHHIEFQKLAVESWGKEVNTKSWQQLQKYLYGHLKLAHPHQSTDKETLESLPFHPCLAPLLRLRKLQKYVSTYIIPCLLATDKEGRIHATYKLHGTKTGRLASANPNMQNIPRLPEVRGMFIAPEGKILIECDLSQAELRSLAVLSGDEELCLIFNSNELSLHDEVTAEIWPEYNTNKIDALAKKELKMRGKAVNFGIVYGRQAPSFVLEFGISMTEAARWIKKWLDRFPKGRDFINRCRSAVSRGDTLVTVFGRKRRFGVITPERRKKLENEASNFPHQSTSSDITLLAGIECEPILIEKYDALIVNTVHDCIIIEAWPKDKDAICKLVTDTMVRIPVEWGLKKVPFESEAEIGTRWGHLEEYHDYQN